MDDELSPVVLFDLDIPPQSALPLTILNAGSLNVSSNPLLAAPNICLTTATWTAHQKFTY